MEIELNFRFDANGRTANTLKSDDSSSKVGDGDDCMDYSSKAVMTNIGQLPTSTMDDLLFDCEISDSGLMPRTFWVPVEGMKPRCTLEQFALDVFHHHVPANLDYDKSKSGAEWWCQLRPSPEAGRYTMHDDKPDDISKTGISFHWDKDEDLRLMAGGNLYLHPHLSTVTYMTDLGSPTLVANSRINPLSGEWMVPGEEGSDQKQVEGFVSWPIQGKHLSFDGRYLHAALPDLMQPGEFVKQIRFAESKDPKEQNLLKRRHRRVTFLVNIWLNYTPFNVEPFPDTMVDKLSGLKENERPTLSFQQEGSVPTGSIPTNSTKVQHLKNDKTIEEKVAEFTWPMGDCDSQERIRMSLPLATIRSQASSGGNVRIHWDTTASDRFFSLHKSPLEASTKRSQEDENADKSVKRPRI